MKTSKILPLLCICLLLARAGIARADQTIPGNLTVQQGLLIQHDTNLWGATSFGHLTENPQVPGLWLSVSQEESTTMQTNVITPGYYTMQNVVVEDYGWVGEQNHWFVDYGWVTVNDYYPAVFDSDGNMVTDGYWGSHMEWQETGGHYGELNYSYGIIGTHFEQQQTWVPDVVENVALTSYGAPHVKFNASRSDTNYDFVFPSASGSGSQWTALSIYSGGLMMTSEDTSRNFALTPWSFHQAGRGSDGADLTAQNSAEETLHTARRSWVETGGGTAVAASKSHLRADALNLVRTESGANGTTTVQTQIAARSAQFGGVVTVEGNLNVKGIVRLLPAGDLDMGAFHKGTRPDGTIDTGN
ncbi:MAG: hypothetical protein ABMA01_10550 [Chthoniobacteraceae bacterium]